MPEVIDVEMSIEDVARMGDPLWRLTNMYWIQTKKPGAPLEQLNPFEAQRTLAKCSTIWKRFLILKARQMGISTFFMLWHLDATMFNPNTTTVIIAHEKKSLEHLFNIIKIAYENCPDTMQLESGELWHKPTAKYDTKHQLYFEGLNSRIYVAFSVRSVTVHRMHISEAAFLKNPEEQMNASLAAVPDDGIVTIESTANGVGGMFHELWEDATGEDTESPYYPLFFGFQNHEEYRDPINSIEAFEKSMSAEEHTMHEKHGVPLAALMWRRRKLTDKAVSKKFQQEYPCNPREAFLHTGRSVFDADMLDDWIILDPLQSEMEDRLLTWVRAEKNAVYVIGVDTSSGRRGKVAAESLGDSEAEKEGGTDYSVIQVWDAKTLQLCAQFRAKWPYAKLHNIVYTLAKRYNNAYVIVEATDHGLTVLNNLEELTDYDTGLIHSERTQDRTQDRKTRKVGFYTNNKSRNLILDAMQTSILEGNLRVHSRRVQSECFRFVTKDDGRMEAMDGYKDDCVMCCAIATYPPNIALALEAKRNIVVSRNSLPM